MTFAELKDAVLNDTKAVQHEDLIARKINASIRFISMSGRYPNDLTELLQTVDATLHAQSLPIPARYRSTSYLINSSCPATKFKGYMADELIAKPNAINVFYQGGSTFHIKHSTLTETFLWGYYTFPADLSADADENWLTTTVPELLVDYAASMVLAQLGEKERIGTITKFSQQNLAIAVRDFIDPGGRTV